MIGAHASSKLLPLIDRDAGDLADITAGCALNPVTSAKFNALAEQAIPIARIHREQPNDQPQLIDQRNDHQRIDAACQQHRDHDASLAIADASPGFSNRSLSLSQSDTQYPAAAPNGMAVSMPGIHHTQALRLMQIGRQPGQQQYVAAVDLTALRSGTGPTVLRSDSR